jgi:hypothetical protein
MKPSFRFRLHDWAAGQFSFVQYPHVRRVYPSSQQKRPAKLTGGALWAFRLVCAVALLPFFAVALGGLYVLLRVFASVLTG